MDTGNERPKALENPQLEFDKPYHPFEGLDKDSIDSFKLSKPYELKGVGQVFFRLSPPHDTIKTLASMKNARVVSVDVVLYEPLPGESNWDDRLAVLIDLPDGKTRFLAMPSAESSQTTLNIVDVNPEIDSVTEEENRSNVLIVDSDQIPHLTFQFNDGWS